jgi:hypothetical protein
MPRKRADILDIISANRAFAFETATILIARRRGACDSQGELGGQRKIKARHTTKNTGTARAIPRREMNRNGNG